MSFTLLIGNKNYSSWSMRAWLLMELLEIPFQEISVALYQSSSRARVRSLGGETGLVPVLIDEKLAIWDTLAIIEYLHEEYSQVWAEARQARARARSLCGEVHSAMSDLRAAMPVNIRARYQLEELSEGVRSDISRVTAIWETCLSESGGPWLFGTYCAGDIVFAPIATRFQTYGISLTGTARDYQDRILSHPQVRRWMSLGTEEATIEIFETPFIGQESH